MTFANRHVVIQECGEQMQQTVETIRSHGWKTHESIWNASLFLNTIAYDLSHNVYDMVYERDEWRRRMVARQLATLIFEIGEDLPGVYGKEFRTSCTALRVPDNRMKALDIELKRVSSLWKETRKVLKDIRTVAGAHRDHDSLKMNEVIKSIDLFALLGIGVKIGELINQLGAASQNILTATSSTMPPEMVKA